MGACLAVAESQMATQDNTQLSTEAILPYNTLEPATQSRGFIYHVQTFDPAPKAEAPQVQTPGLVNPYALGGYTYPYELQGYNNQVLANAYTGYNPYVVGASPYVAGASPYVARATPYVAGASPYIATASPYLANQYAVNPYVANPYVANPYAANLYAVNPYVVNPYLTSPYGLASGYPVASSPVTVDASKTTDANQDATIIES